MRAAFTLVATLLSVFAFAQDVERVKMLEQKVSALEQRVARLESQMRYVTRPEESTQAKKAKKSAEQRVALDAEKYPASEIALVEAMYMRASPNIDDPAAKATLDSIVARYPKLNRAGCALLYRAQRETGNEKERLLNDCIDRFAGCYYLDGTQVGPLAMLQLAEHYRLSGKPDDAAKLFKRIKKEHREAVDHRGNLLVSQID